MGIELYLSHSTGGPGGSGTELIQGGIGELISNLTQGQYDIVSKLDWQLSPR